MKKEQDFVDYFIKVSNFEKCPFMAHWFYSKFTEFQKLPEKPSREGIPKGDPMPVPRSKWMLSLHRTVYPVNLKMFAEYVGVSYGVVKVWNSAEDNEDRIADLSLDFTMKFIKKFCEIVDQYGVFHEKPESIPHDDFGLKKDFGVSSNVPKDFLKSHPLSRFLSELKYYNRYVPKNGATGLIPLLLWKIMPSVMATRAKSLEYRLAYRQFRNAINQTHIKAQTLQEFIGNEDLWQKNEATVYKFYFRELIEEAEKGNSKDVVEIAKYLENYFADEIMPVFFELLREKRIQDFKKSRYGRKTKKN